MAHTTLDVQPLSLGEPHPETSRQSMKKQIVISLLCTAALVAAFAAGHMTAAGATADQPRRDSGTLANVGLRNQENSDLQVRGSLSEELSQIWAAIEGLRTETGTQSSEISNQINQESADRQAALTQLNVTLQTTFTNLEDVITTTSANLAADLQQEVSHRGEAVANTTSAIQGNIDVLSTSISADLATEAAARDASDSNLENILACRPGLIRDPNDTTKCITCSENQFWSALSGCTDCPAHSTATPGATSCTCTQGYATVEDGSCQDVDECETSNPCNAGETCSNSEGSYTCVAPNVGGFNFGSPVPQSFQVDSNSQTTTFSADYTPVHAVFDPNDSDIFWSMGFEAALYKHVISAQTEEKVWQGDGYAFVMTFDLTGTKIIWGQFANGVSEIVSYDIAANSASTIATINDAAAIYGICPDTDGTIYFTESSRMKLRKLDTDGEVRHVSFSMPMDVPFGSCVVGKDKIYLTTHSPDSIWALDKTTWVASEFVEIDGRPPIGIVHDAQGNLLVSAYPKALLKVTSAGVVSQISSGTPQVPFEQVQGLDADANRALITDFSGKRFFILE